MLISLLTYLLISNALSLRKDKSILFSRIVMVSLISTSLLAFNNLSVISLDKGIGIYGGLFHVTAFNNLFVISLDKGIGIYGGLSHVTAFTQSFNILIFKISAIIFTLTTFYPRKVYLNQYSTLTKLIFSKLTYNIQNVINITNEWFNIANIIYNNNNQWW